MVKRLIIWLALLLMVLYISSCGGGNGSNKSFINDEPESEQPHDLESAPQP